jgi:hypothetical protein
MLTSRRRHSRVGLLMLVLGLLTAISAGSALATVQAFRTWETSSNGWKGSRVTISNPSSGESSIALNDFLLGSAYADSGVSSAIQAGVTYEWQAPQPVSCDLGSAAPTLYYFVEIIQVGNATCYQRGAAATTTANLHSVVRGTDGTWRAYRNGNFQHVQNSWTACAGDACTISAFAEELRAAPGLFHAKFAGPGNTTWQFWNGSVWNQINSASLFLGTCFKSSGPFPGGIWSLIYDRVNTGCVS